MKNVTILFFIAMVALAAGCGDLRLGGFSPAAPENLAVVSSAGANGAKQVLLTWSLSKSTTTSQGATFNVYRGLSATGSLADKTKIAAGITATTFVDTFPAAGTSRHYQVTTTINGLESSGSNEAAIGGEVVSDSLLVLTGSSSASSNNLSWNALPGATGYVVYRGVTPSVSISDKLIWTFILADAGTTAFNDKSVSVGQTLFYQVVATYPDFHSLVSNEIALTTR